MVGFIVILLGIIINLGSFVKPNSAIADCAIYQIRDIFPTTKDVGDVVEAARSDLGPTFDNNGVEIFSRYWQGGPGRHRRLSIRIYIYPNGKLAKERVEKYGKALGSKKIKLSYADVGYTPKLRYNFRRYYLLAQRCVVIELLSDYPDRRIVAPQDYLLKLMVNRINKLKCLCQEIPTSNNTKIQCPTIKKLILTPPKPSPVEKFKIKAIVDNPAGLKYSIEWNANCPFKHCSSIVHGVHGNQIMGKPYGPNCGYKFIAKLTANGCETEKEKVIQFSETKKGINHPPNIDVDYYLDINKKLIFDINTSDPDNDKVYLKQKYRYNYPAKQIGANRYILELKIPSKARFYYFDAMDSHCAWTTKKVFVDPSKLTGNPNKNTTKNKPPIVKLSILSKNKIVKGETVCFYAKATDPDGDRVKLNWIVDGVRVYWKSESPCWNNVPIGKHTVLVVASDGKSISSSSIVFLVKKRRKSCRILIDKTRYIPFNKAFSKWNGNLSKTFKGNTVCYQVKLNPRTHCWPILIKWFDPNGKTVSTTSYNSSNISDYTATSCVFLSRKGYWTSSVSTNRGLQVYSDSILVVEKNTFLTPITEFNYSSLAETWSKNWRIVNVIKNSNGGFAKIGGSNENFGWKKPARRIGDAMPPKGAKGAVYYTHPASPTKPTILIGRYFVSSKKKSLMFRVAGNINGNFVLEIKINGKEAFQRVVDGKRWYKLTVPLQRYYGKIINVEMLIKANGWYYEYAFIDEIGLVNTQFTDKYGFEYNTDRPGYDYKNFDLPQNNALLCKQACEKDPRCKAWTFVKPNTIQGPHPRCWLKYAVPNPIQSTYCISGVKKASIFPPIPPSRGRIFEKPRLGNYRLDWCKIWGTECGKPAADAFCQHHGYKEAIRWAMDPDIGATSPTKIITTGQICNLSFCDGFKFIECTNIIKKPNIAGGNYIGCFKDQWARDLNGFMFQSNNMTPQKCINVCSQKGYKYAGVQYSSQCFCGSSYGKYGKASNCNMHCSGDSNQICGGRWANSVYKITH